MKQIEKIDLRAAAEKLSAYWTQEVLGSANGSLFKVVRGKDATNWHTHSDEDEVFLVLEGELVVQLRDRDVQLKQGEFFIVPSGVEHCPKAANGEDVLLLVIGTSVTSTREGGKPDWSFE